MSPIFFHKAESWSFGAGFRYESTNLDFPTHRLWTKTNLHSIDLPLFFSKTQSETLDWMILFNPSLAGDYEQVDDDSLNYLALAGARWKKAKLSSGFSEPYTRRDSMMTFSSRPSDLSGSRPINRISSSQDLMFVTDIR